MCIKGLTNISDTHKNKSELVNLKSKNFLTHQNENLFNILWALETWFSKHDSSPDVFENTYNEFFLVCISKTKICLYRSQKRYDDWNFYYIRCTENETIHLNGIVQCNNIE